MAAALSLVPGSRLGTYEIVAPLGAGGMGEVFRARDARLGREVALKLLPPAFADDPERLARFEREAKLLAALNHPGIAHLYGLEEADGRRFLVLEVAEGEDLSAHIARGRLPIDDALAIARQVAEALEAAHEKGIVHRDLKPGNVKVGADGQAKVLDFGLAKAWSGEAAGAISSSGAVSQSPTLAHGGTEAGVILGTAAYMSPEQARGRPVDKRADVWAFGVVLYEMLTARRLFGGETVTDVLAAVVRQDVDWSALPADTPPRVVRLMRRCLERDPKLRLRDIGEARIALAQPDAPAPVETAKPSPGLSRRAAAGLVAGAAGGAFALGFGLGRRFGTGPGAATEPYSVTRITSSGNVTGAAISPDGRLVVYVESEQGEQSLWLRQLATGQTLRIVPPGIAFYWGFAFTRDGNSIVYGLHSPEDIDGAFYSISTLGGTPRRLVGGIDSAPAFSPDGRRMAWARARHPAAEQSALMVANADGSEARVLAAFSLPQAVAPIFWTAPDWSPDGRRIACSVVRIRGGSEDGGGRVVAVSVDDGAVETLADPGWSWAAQVAWLPDARDLLAVAAADVVEPPQVWLVPLPQGAPRRITTDLNDYRIVSLSADGTSLVTVAADAMSSVWVTPRDGSSRPRRITNAKFDGLYGLDFAPDGRIVYSSRDGGKDGLWVTSADGSDRRPLEVGEGVVREPRVTPPGQVFYAARTRSVSEIRRVPLDGGAPRTVVTGTLGNGFAVSPDEQMVAFSALHEGESRLFRKSVSGGPPERLTDAVAFSPVFSADGTRLAFYYVDRASNRFRVGIIASGGGPLVQSLEAAPPPAGTRMVFRDEGLYVNSVSRDRANVWLLPLDGRPPQRVTDFEDLILYGFAVSPDGSFLAYSRGPRTRDAVLIRGFR